MEDINKLELYKKVTTSCLDYLMAFHFSSAKETIQWLMSEEGPHITDDELVELNFHKEDIKTIRDELNNKGELLWD